jgi:hypothetical protein
MTFCLGSATAFGEAPPPTRAEVWSWRPYTVTVDLRIAPDLRGDAAWLDRFRTRLSHTLEAAYRPLWDVELVEAPTLPGAPLVTPAAPTADPPTDPKADAVQKRFELTVDRVGSTWQIAAHERDDLTQTATRELTERTADPDRVELVCAELLGRLFRPVALVDPLRGGGVTVTFRGERLWPASLPRPESRPTELFYRYLNKARVVESIQRLPFTYLEWEQAPPAGGEGADDAAAAGWQVASGLRSPLSARRQRVDVVAIGVGPLVPATRLTLRSRKSATRRLIGVDLLVTWPGSETPQRLVSDRLGRVELERVDPSPDTGSTTARGEAQLARIEVRSGKTVLARVPLVVGSERETILELADDSLRLTVEGDLAILQASVIDTVSRRAVLMARIRRDARLGLWPTVDSGWKELAALPTRAKYLAEVTTLRLPAQAQAKAERDRVAESRIKKLCTETEEMIARFLADDPVALLKTELDDLQAVRREEDEAAKQAAAKKARDAKAAAEKAEARKAKPPQTTPQPPATPQPPPPATTPNPAPAKVAKPGGAVRESRIAIFPQHSSGGEYVETYLKSRHLHRQ